MSNNLNITDLDYQEYLRYRNVLNEVETFLRNIAATKGILLNQFSDVSGVQDYEKFLQRKLELERLSEIFNHTPNDHSDKHNPIS